MIIWGLQPLESRNVLKHFIFSTIVNSQEEFWGVSSPLCVEKTNSEVNISHETTTMVVSIYDGI